jgi:gliding motility associated protien GldN
MKLLSILVAIALFSSIAKAQEKRAYYKNAHLKYQVNTKDGRLNGSYTSWHPNGQKKATGQFLNNQRTGSWKVWSPAGILKVHRVYQNNFQFKVLAYQDDQGTSLPIPDFLVYELTKNEADLIPYPATKPSNVYWEKCIWRKIENKKDNAPLFSGASKKVLFKELATTEKIPIYKADSDVFKEAFNARERKELLNQKELKLVGYAIKEVQFFELTRNLSESRILGICPIVIVDGKKKALCWLKYEDIRPFLAKQKVNVAYNPMVETVEDWLHFRHFQGLIEKESNVYDRTIADYTTGSALKEEQERIEMKLIDVEHDFWMFQEIN